MNMRATAAVRLLAGDKEPVRLASTGNLALAGLLTVDGVATAPGNRVLIKSQTDATQNGIYTAAEGRWYRSPDANGSRHLRAGMMVYVQEGTQAGQMWSLTSDEPDIGSDDIEFELYLSTNLIATSTAAMEAAEDAAAAAAVSAAAAAGYVGGALQIYTTRAALAAATVPSTITSALTLGYASSGDTTPITFVRNTSQRPYGSVRSADRFLPNGTVDASNGGWWVYVPGPAGIDACAFGYKADWNGTDTGVTDNATALQNAINFSSLSFGTGFDTGGGGGNDVLLPSGTGMVGSPIIVHDGVRVLGKGTYATVLKMKNTFAASGHFFRLGTPGDAVAVAASQTKASAGDLVINGTLASGGVATFLQKRVVSVYSAGNDSARTFTVYGTAAGVSINQSVTGANAGKVDTAGYFDTVTRVAVNGATASTVTVGFETRAAFGSRLEKMQLFATTTNAALGKSMVYSNNAQHTAGVKDIKVFGGNRHCVFFETGIGGASYFTCDDVETFNHGNSVGVASNNSQIKLNYAGLLTNIRNIVMGGPGPSGGAAARGLEILGGNVIGENIHAEGISDGIVISIPTENEGTVQLRNVNGNPATTNLIHIDSVTDNNTVVVSSIFGNGSTVTIKDDPGAASVTGNVIPWTTY